MSRLFFALIGFLFIDILSAQYCGTPQEPLLERIEVNKKSLQFHQRSVLKYVPVTFHLVAATNGSGRITEENVLLQVANINEQFADQEAIFYIDRLNYFDNDAVYNTPSSSAATTQMRLRKDNNSINVFITNTADSGNGGPGVTLAYYDPGDDWIVARKANINGTASTLAHEIGHFFSLAHPHAGWDCYPYTVVDYGNPVNVDFTKQCDLGGGSLLIELQNGTNCNAAGDRLCDTPPDYNLGLLYQNNCDTNKVIKDKNNTLIRPMTNNFMGYYTDCIDYAFTQTQKNLMTTDFYTPQRQYIRTTNVPDTLEVTGPVDYISPINGEESPGYTNVFFDWEDTPEANQYLFIIDRFQSFSQNPQRVIVNKSEIIIDELLPNVTYYWKVWPFNESRTDAGYSQAQNFKTGTGVGVNEISEINAYSISPNPVNSSLDASLILTSTTNFEAEMRVSDISGCVMLNKNLTIPSGISQHTVNTQDLPAGIYFVMLHSKSGVLIERLVVVSSE